jgi:hypothetical protein
MGVLDFKMRTQSSREEGEERDGEGAGEVEALEDELGDVGGTAARLH